MDIEQQLREMLVLRDPGARFTDDVLARVGDVPDGQARDGVVRLADVRNSRLGRRVLLGVLVVVGAAAAMLPFLLDRDDDVPGAQDGVALLTPAGGAAADPAAATGIDQTEPVGSEGLIDCIDPDVLYGLLLGPGIANFRISTDVMPQLAAFNAPRELTWLGGTERDVGGTRQLSTVYRTSLAPEAARIAAAEALNSSGWTLHSDGRQLGAGVFVSASPQAAATYCREGVPVGVTAGELEGVTYVVLSTTGRTGGFSGTCERPPQVAARGTSPLDEHLPTLQLPRDPATGQLAAMQGGGGGTGGSSTRRANARFHVKDTVANVAQHFGSQMARQGWQSATSWSGTGSAGSTWSRRLDDDTVVESALVVTAFEDDQFTVMFRAVMAE